MSYKNKAYAELLGMGPELTQDLMVLATKVFILSRLLSAHTAEYRRSTFCPSRPAPLCYSWCRYRSRYTAKLKLGFDLDLLRDKTKLAFKKIFSLSYPEYSTDISIMAESTSQIAGELPAESASEDKDSNSAK